MSEGEPAADEGALIPRASERDGILAALAQLVLQRGYEHLALAPLVEPDERHFPDRWGGGEASVARIVRRLAIYADLEQLEPRIVIEPDGELGSMTPAGIGSPAWFGKLEGTTAVIALRESTLREPLVLVPALARAVAAAFRAHHRIAVNDPAREETLVDLTCIYLGFGLLTVPAAVRHYTVKSGARPRAAVSRLGVVEQRSLAYALAAVLEVRAPDDERRRAIAKRIGENPSAFVEAARAQLATLQPTVRERLGVPPREGWSDPPTLSLLAGPLEDDGPAASQEQRRDEDRGVVGMNAGKPVFRVERSKALRMAKMFGLPVLLLGMLAGRMAHSGIEIEMWKAMAMAAGLALFGLGLGRLFPDSRCSEPKCGEPLPKDATVCPRCGGRIAGVIHHPRERLGAEEALARAESRAPE